MKLKEKGPLSVSPVLSVGLADVGVLWQTVGRIKMPLGTKVGLRLGHIVLNGDQLPKRSTAPSHFRPMSVVVKHMDGSRCHATQKVRKGCVKRICFTFSICSLIFKLQEFKVAQSPDCGAKFAVFRSSKYTGVGGGYSNPLSLGISQ